MELLAQPRLMRKERVFDVDVTTRVPPGTQNLSLINSITK